MVERQRNEKLIRARIEAGHSQESLAEKLLISYKSIGRWETDFVIPHPDTRNKVAKLLGKTPKELGFEDRPLRKLKPKQKSEDTLTFSPHIPPDCQYVVNMTYEQALSHGIIPFEDTVQGSYERGEQEDGMDKRQFLVQGKNIIAAGVGASIIGDAPLSTMMIPAEEFLPQCAISLKSCWWFLDLGNLDMTEQIIEVNIPTLLSLTLTPSKHQQAAATLMTQAKIIQSIIAGHQARYSQGEMYRKEAIKWSQLSGNPTIMAAALMYLGMTYVYYSPRKPQQGIDKLIEALHVLGNRPSILVSVIYITLANAYSQQAKEQETLSSLALAKENYPKHPQHDLSFLLADCSIQSLRDREGSALNKLASRLGNKEYYAKADTVLTESLTADRVPRGRIDAIRNKANAALGLGNLDLYVAHAEESILLAVSTESKWSYTKAQGIHEHIPQQWRHEQAIRDLEGVFDSVRKSLFSSEQTK